MKPDLTVPGPPNVLVVGDLASCIIDGKPVPGIAPAAKQMGRCAGGNVLRLICNKKTTVFRYRDYGSLATIGRHAGVAVVSRMKLWGHLA